MDYVDSQGKGESYSRTHKHIIIRLLNEPITHKEMTGFIEGLKEQGILPKDVRVFWGKENKTAYGNWGLAYYVKKEIIIKRRCVGTFLHEVAHFVDVFYHENSPGHSHSFGQCYDRLIVMWENNETKY